MPYSTSLYRGSSEASNGYLGDPYFPHGQQKIPLPSEEPVSKSISHSIHAAINFF